MLKKVINRRRRTEKKKIYVFLSFDECQIADDPIRFWGLPFVAPQPQWDSLDLPQ